MSLDDPGKNVQIPSRGGFIRRTEVIKSKSAGGNRSESVKYDPKTKQFHMLEIMSASGTIAEVERLRRMNYGELKHSLADYVPIILKSSARKAMLLKIARSRALCARSAS